MSRSVSRLAAGLPGTERRPLHNKVPTLEGWDTASYMQAAPRRPIPTPAPSAVRFAHRHRDVRVSSRSQPQLAAPARAQAAAQQPQRRSSGGQRGSPPPLKAVEAPAAEVGAKATTQRAKIANSVTELIGDTPMVRLMGCLAFYTPHPHALQDLTTCSHSRLDLTGSVWHAQFRLRIKSAAYKSARQRRLSLEAERRPPCNDESLRNSIG